jgi:hypothetical protein
VIWRNVSYGVWESGNLRVREIAPQRYLPEQLTDRGWVPTHTPFDLRADAIAFQVKAAKENRNGITNKEVDA